MPKRKDIFGQKEKVDKLFEDGTLEANKKDIFEQIICFTLSEQFNISKNLVDYFAGEAKFIENIK